MGAQDLTHDAVEVRQRVGEFVVSGVLGSEGRQLFSKLLLLFGVKRKFDQNPLCCGAKVNKVLVLIW